MEEKLKMEIVKTGNENLIILILSEQIVKGIRGYILETIEDVDYEGFNLSEETRNICKKIFSIDGIFELELNQHQISVFKTNKADWKILEPQIVSIFE